MRIVIWGAGNTGALVSYILHYRSDISVAAVLDDDPRLAGQERRGVPVITPDREALARLRREGVEAGIVAIGNGRLREKYSALLEAEGLRIINAIHPTAFLSPDVKLGKGVIVCARATLFYNPTVGNHVFIGPGVTISHDSVIEDNVELAAGCLVVARVRVGRNAFVGAGAHLMAKDSGPLAVGENATVGIGAAVVDDVPANAVVVGVPARVIRYREVQEDPGTSRGRRSEPRDPARAAHDA